MRMWMVDPSTMCRKHLLGEHGEIHKHRHVFVKQHSIKGRYGQIEPLSMKQRHDELSLEMVKRGFKHESSYELPDLSYLPLNDLNGIVNQTESIKDLYDRCLDCRLKENERNL